MLPNPSSSLIVPITARLIVKPMPIPNASIIEGNTGFFCANASALPKIMQFTTINGTYGPSALDIGGNMAARNMSATVTYRAMMTTYAAILTWAGTIFLIADTVIFEQSKTNNVASPIATPLITEFVTASVGHVPSTSLNGGISCQSPFLNSYQRL